MWKAALVGAVALATVGSWPASAQDIRAGEAPRVVVLKAGDISRFKARLRLTPSQEQYWPAVEAAWHDLARRQTEEFGSAGLASRIGHRILGVALDAVAFQRLAVAAQPLLRSLDEGQKRDATVIAQSLGIERLASAF